MSETLDNLADEITRLAGHMNAIDYCFIKRLDEFDARHGWVGDGIKSLSHWLNWKCGMGAEVGREKVRVARALRDLPQIDEAFRTGQVSYSEVRAMTRVATADNEEYLLDVARHGTTAHVEQLTRYYRRCRKLNEDEPMGELERNFVWHQDEDGMYVFRGKLPADEGELVATALRKMLDLIHLDSSDPEKNVSAETFSGPQQPEDFTCSNASALVRMAEHWLATSESGANTLPGSEKYQLLIHVNVNEASRDCKVEGDVALNYENGGFIHPEVVRKLACDASIRTVGEDDAGNVLSIGRRSRVVPPHLRRAVEHRDKGCRFPNCHQRRWTEAHHIITWLDGGETSLPNLISLCRWHHTRLHQHEYHIEKTGDEVRFVSKLGHTIDRVLISKPHDAANVVKSIEADTAVPVWINEKVDYDMALEWLSVLDGAARSGTSIRTSEADLPFVP